MVVSAISSVVPSVLSNREILINPTKINNLRAVSVVKVDRIVTLKREAIIADLGKLASGELASFKNIFTEIVN